MEIGRKTQRNRTNFGAFFAKNFLIFIFFILSVNFVFSAKNQRTKQNKAAEETKKTLWDIPTKTQVTEQRHRCPEKRAQRPTEGADEQIDGKNIGLMGSFKNYVRKEGKIESMERFKVRINSLQKVLEGTIGGILAFAGKMEPRAEFAEEIGKWESEWREIEGKKQHIKMDSRQQQNWVVCLMYELGAKMAEGMGKKAAQNAAQMGEEWRHYAKQKRLADIFKVETSDCDSWIGIIQTMVHLTNPPKGWPFIGLTLMDLLEKSENFRHFFCHEVPNPDQIKVSLAQLTSAKYLTLLENAFPEVLRIDILTMKTTRYRIRQMLLNRSNSEQYINNFLQFVSALLVNEMTKFSAKFSGDAAPHKASPALRLLGEKANAAATDALRHFGSTFHLCVMNKILDLARQLDSENEAEKVTEKTVKKLRTNECKESRVQHQMMAHAMGSRLGALITFAIVELSTTKEAKFKSMFRFPGVRTRLLRLVGTAQRADKVTERCNLAPMFADNALVNDDLFWVHYLNAMCRADQIERQSHKFGADLAAFVRWLRHKLTVVHRLNSLFEKLRNYISDLIYDPIFDADETALSDMEKILEEKRHGKAKNGEYEAKKLWMSQMHAEEFRKLLKNGKMGQLDNALNIFGSKTIREGKAKGPNGKLSTFYAFLKRR